MKDDEEDVLLLWLACSMMSICLFYEEDGAIFAASSPRSMAATKHYITTILLGKELG